MTVSSKTLRISSPLPDPDSDLLPRLMAGDQAAFTTLVDRHIRKLTALAANMLGDPFQAEDVVQSVFLKTWTMLPNWQTGNARLLTWMRKVATRECLDQLRRKAPVYMDAPPDLLDERTDAHKQVENLDKAAQLRRAVASLGPDQQAAITLTYYQHLSQKEAADILGRSVPAYESLLRRGRAALKTWLDQDMTNQDMIHQDEANHD